MKNQFLSKAVPRGTRTIWRYLSALILLFSLSIGQMWGAVTTEVYDASGASSSTTMTKTGSTLAGTYVAGQGGGAISGYTPSNKGVKLRTQTTKVTVSETEYGYAVITANSGYVLKSFKIEGTSNGSNSIDLLGVYVDVDATSASTLATALATATNQLSSTVTIPNKSTTYVSSPNLSINASSNIVMLFPGSGDNQMRAIITIGYEEASGGGCSAPTDPAISGASAFTEGDDISLTASATGATSATFTWYKGADWATASAGSSIASGATLTINNCTTSDEGTYWCNISNGTSCEVQVSHAVVVATATPVCPSGLTISGTQVYDEGQTISLEATLTEGNGEISYQWYKGSIAAGNEVGTNSNVLTIANCAVSDGGDYFCVASKPGCSLDAESSAFAVTVNALVACTELVPATSGDAIAANDAISLSTATGGSMKALTANLSYTENGLLFGSSSSTKAEVTLSHLMQPGTIIRATIYNANNDKNRGLKLLNSSGTTKATWQKNILGDHVEEYTVVAGDGLAGSNVFQLQRAENAYLKSLKVFNCGAELFAINTAVSPADPTGLATVSLDKELAAAGETVTATATIADPSAYEFDYWVINGATLDDATKNPTHITMGSNPATITVVLKQAGTKHTVTYYDDASVLGSELVDEGGHPTGAGLAPRKLGYSFAGWSLTPDGAIANLNEINVASNLPLYAQWNAIDCSAQSGTIYTMEIAVAPAANCTIKTASGFESTLDLYPYGGISGGEAMLANTGSSNNCILQTNKTILLKDNVSYLKLDFDCPLKEGDKIQSSISGNTAWVSTDATRPSGTSTALAVLPSSSTGEFVIPAASGLIDAQTIYVWKGGGNVTITSINVVRAAKYAVTFNMHGHGDAVDPQSVVEGGKVTKPTDPTASGWDFGGWFTDDTYGTIWDFENMTISAATEIHALWTVHTTSSDASLSDLKVNGVTVPNFSATVTNYNVELPMGTSLADVTITGTTHDANAEITQIDYPSELPGTAMVTVRAEDGTTLEYYTLILTVATSKDINLVWATGTTPCKGTPDMSAQILSNNAAVSTYINQISFTNVEGTGDDGAEGTSLNVGKKAGNMFTLTAKPGYAFAQMHFFAKIQDANCEYSIDGSDWTELASANTGGNECYAPFSGTEVHEFRLRSTGANGVWIRNMQLNIIEACMPVAITWDEEPVEFEVGKTGQSVSATANNGGIIAYGSSNGSVIAIDAGDGGMTVWELGSTTLSASTPEGDGTTFCTNGGEPIVISKVVSTYFLVKFDAQNGEDPAEVKYHDSDMEVALPATDPLYPGHTFTGWFDAATGGNPVTTAFAPNVSMTIYAHWTTDCDAPTIDVQPASANYFTGRTAVALNCEATAAGSGALSYVWYSCDDELRTNPIELAGAPTPNTDVAGTFYFFCAVTEEGCGNVAYSNVAVITVADKDPVCLVKAELAAGSSAASITSTSGYYKDDANIAINVAKDLKLGGTGKYVKVAVEGTNFRDGDVVEITLASDKTASAWLQIFADEGTTLVAEMTSGVTREHPNNLTISGVPANTKTLYLYRTEAAGSNMNPYPTSMAVYRACAPILNKVTVAGVDGTPDNTNHVAIEVPFSTLDAALDAIAYDWVSNDAAWTATHEPAVANAWEWGVENTVTFTDEDGDASVYYVTISKAAASTDATLSALTVNGQAIALADGVFEYTFELPYGTSVVPTVVATPNHVAAVATVDPCTLSGATITVVPESGEDDKQVYTLTFVISKWQEVAIWDGSYMTELATSPGALGMAWETVGFGSIGSYTTTYGEKSYSKYLPSSGSSTGRYMTLTVPEGYVAKFYVVMASHSDGNERGMYIGSNLVKDPDATSVLELSNNDRDIAVAGMSEIVGAGTWYINPNASIDFQEIRAFLRPGFCRTDMLGNGVLGTVCVDHNVAIEDIQGVTVYELVGREPQYGKVAFDEIVTGELEAGAPYVFQAHGDRMVLFYGEDKVDDPVDKGNGMYGTFEKIVLPNVDLGVNDLNDIYYFAQRALWSCVGAEDLTVAANRAYVKLSEIDYLDVNQQNPAPGRRRILMEVNGENQAQGFENLESGDAPVKVMIDGTLYILRGEKVFDATGRLVK